MVVGDQVQSIGGLLTETCFVDKGFLGDDRVHSCRDVRGDGVADYRDDLVAFFYRLCSLTIRRVHLLVVLVSTLDYGSDGRTWHNSHGIPVSYAVCPVDFCERFPDCIIAFLTSGVAVRGGRDGLDRFVET